MQTIMLATDFSERSDRALRRAVILARQTGARIDLVHIVDDDRPRRIIDHEAADARRLLAELGRSLKTLDGVQSASSVILGDPFAGIAKAAADHAPNLLVIGPHRRRILRDAFVGTTAERTIRAVECPVLMVNGPPVGPWRNVLLTTDLSDHSRDALRRYWELGFNNEGRTSILTIFDALALRLAASATVSKDSQADYLQDRSEKAYQDLKTFQSGLGANHVELLVQEEETSIATEILTVAEKLRSDLIVVSTQGKGAVARMLLGSVAQQILRDAAADVLVIAPAKPN